MKNEKIPVLAGRARGALLAVMLLSAAGLAYEITLTRLFSLMFQYQDVFLIVTVSIAGLGVGAALATLAIQRSRDAIAWQDLVQAALLLAVLLVGAALVISQLSSARHKLVALAAAALPFVGIGFINSALFSQFGRFGATLYAADLLGGVLGLLAALAAVSALGALDGIIALAVVCALIAALLAWTGQLRAPQRVALAAAGLLILALAVNRAAGWVAFEPERLKDAPPDKTMMMVLHSDPTARITETRWGPFARLDVIETGDEAVRYVFTDAGAGSTMIRYTGDDRRVRWLTTEAAYLPFTVNADQTASALILGAGAGKDVLMARLAGIPAITAVEINPQMIDLTRDYAAYNGGIFDLPGVEVVAADGRNYVERSEKSYDLIYANLVYSQAAAPGTSALAESYVFTREALRAYWDRLSDNGRIGFVTHHGIEGLRLLVAALDMLMDEGFTLQEALDHVALASLQGSDAQTRTSVLLILRQPWTSETIGAFVDEAHQRGLGLLYLPGFQELGLEGLVQGQVSLEQYIADNADEYTFEPTTDDWPFFYLFTPGLPGQLNDLLFVGAIALAVYLSWAMFFFVRRKAHWKRAALMPYFALLGAAFMLVEIPLIQRFNLLLGQPSLALVVVIGTLLAGGGIGSLISGRLAVNRLPRGAGTAALGVGALVAASLVVYPALIEAALPLGLALRVAITVLALLPVGLLIGVPFPGGLRVGSQVDSRGVAAFWGANATASVLGSTLAMALAVETGFSAALLAGAGLYVAAAGLAFFVWPRLLAE